MYGFDEKRNDEKGKDKTENISHLKLNSLPGRFGTIYMSRMNDPILLIQLRALPLKVNHLSRDQVVFWIKSLLFVLPHHQYPFPSIVPRIGAGHVRQAKRGINHTVYKKIACVIVLFPIGLCQYGQRSGACKYFFSTTLMLFVKCKKLHKLRILLIGGNSEQILPRNLKHIYLFLLLTNFWVDPLTSLRTITKFVF